MAKRLLVPGVIVLVLLAAGFTMFRSDDVKYVTASFPRTIAIYEGSEVKVLGVNVGIVESVEPVGTEVKVRMAYDADVDVPADAEAVIIQPSVVGDRFVQLTPVYTSDKKKLADNANLDSSRTATPLELDEVYDSIDQLTVALGPEGANSDGALSELISVTAENFAGQGEQFNETVHELGRLTGTLENNKDELFGSAAELGEFVNTLATNDQVVRDFNTAMASVSELLAGERQELAASLKNLATAMTQVQTFVKDNRALLTKNIKGIDQVAKVLVKRRDQLDEILHVAPLALNNLYLTYNPQAGTLDTRANIGNIGHELQNNPGLFLCGIVEQVDASGAACNLIKAILPRSATFGMSAGKNYDPTFGGLLGAGR